MSASVDWASSAQDGAGGLALTDVDEAVVDVSDTDDVGSAGPAPLPPLAFVDVQPAAATTPMMSTRLMRSVPTALRLVDRCIPLS